MKLIWSPTAERNAHLIWEYIAQDNLQAADRIRERLDATAEHLEEYPLMGRAGRAKDTRELVVSGTPYLLIYRISGEIVEITRVLHGAQDWPPKG